MDADERSAVLDGEEISLTAREFDLLYKLLSYPKKTFTRTQLMDEFWTAAMVTGIIVGIAGGILASLAYPIYTAIVKAKRKQLAPEIIRLTDELMK